MIHRLLCKLGIHCWMKSYPIDDKQSLERTCLVCFIAQRLQHCPDGIWEYQK